MHVEDNLRLKYERVNGERGKRGDSREAGKRPFSQPAAEKYTELQWEWNRASLLAKNITHR